MPNTRICGDRRRLASFLTAALTASVMAANAPATQVSGPPPYKIVGPVPRSAVATMPAELFGETKELLGQRKFKELTRLIEKEQKSLQKPDGEFRLMWRINPFLFDDATALIDQWLLAEPKSWPALLARAINRGALALSARAPGPAIRTPPDKLRVMKTQFDGLRSDCRAVLATNPSVCPCYEEIAIADMNMGEITEPSLARGLEVCPRDGRLAIMHLFAERPAWGGSMEGMRAAVVAAKDRGVAPAVLAELRGFVVKEEAAAIRRGGDAHNAAAWIDKAARTDPSGSILEEQALYDWRIEPLDPQVMFDASNRAFEISGGGLRILPSRLRKLLLSRANQLIDNSRLEEATVDIDLGIRLGGDVEPFQYLREMIEAIRTGRSFEGQTIGNNPEPPPTPSRTPSPSPTPR